MENKALQGKKIVVVDDDPHFRQKYASLAQELGANVVMAEGVRAGIEVILAEKPDAVITDKDMPDGSGNDVADAVKKAYSDVPVAGITGGDPGNFNDNVDIKLSKGIRDQDYKALVKILAESRDPKADFEAAMGKLPGLEAVARAVNDYAAGDILIQGYQLAKVVMGGVQPIPGMKLRVVSEETARGIFDSEDVKIDVAALNNYRKNELANSLQAMALKPGMHALREAVADFVNNPAINEFMDDLAAKRLDAIAEKKQYEIFHDAYMKMAEVYMEAE